MDLHAALRPHGDAVVVRLEVTAGAKEPRFPGPFNPWRGRLGISVRAPARDGAANAAVLAAVADFFDVPRAQVRLLAGAQDPRKDVLVPRPLTDVATRLEQP